MSGISDQYPFQSLQSSKYSEQISRQLLQRIIDGHFKPGERLPPERDLAAIFNVSRVVVRESIGSLEAKGIVDVRQGRGTTVNPVDEWNTLDSHVLLLLHGDEVFSQLMETRQIIEPEMAALAAERILDDELEPLRLCSELPEDDTVEEHVERDMNFHLMIAKATHNPVLLMVLSSTSELLREGRRRIFNVPGELAKARQWHQAIYEAIASRDSDAAREAMAAHMEQVRQGLKTKKAR
ncbi:MAG: FadR/GntR family transcriptional regulator [Chloroflexota bacterium]|jgi:DNA-binding FadR family transcriptional regulator